tara:strand:+ start:260 stop:445 length:186 start_codon:yes stop_codon:yes gene_type:complete
MSVIDYQLTKEYQISITWGTEVDGTALPETYTFKTKEELNAFRLGAAEACGWSDYNIEGEE